MDDSGRFSWLVSVPNLAGRRGSAAEPCTVVMGLDLDPDGPVTTEVPDAAGCQMVPQIES